LFELFIFSLIGNITAAVTVALTGVLPALISSTKPTELGNFPNYLLVYLHHLVIPQCVICLAIFVYFFPNQQLMSMYKRQFITIIDFVKNCVSFEKA
jgi:hypothetical protein